VVAVFAFLYAIRTIYRQKKLSELHKDFVNNMTHEFKTPLSSIRLASMVIQGAQEIEQNDRLKNYAKIISDQSKRLSAQVENVLDIVQSEKKFVLQKEDVMLIPLLDNLLEVECTRFASQNLQVKKYFETDDLIIRADKYHLSNVVSNIIENAVKYKKEGTPSSRIEVTIKLEKHPRGYLLSFHDNGLGIDDGNQKMIFNKFYRIPTGNVHNVKGFGLGLYYVKNICNLHGWEITVDSKLGEGSTFKILIPN
jgi:two-component system phosphate regulon sensor histidine kinase PhoR